jgi:hypothetical protein
VFRTAATRLEQDKPREIVLIEGGVGDFLQNLPFILASRSRNYTYFVLSHFRNSSIFFRTIRQRIDRYFIYSDLTGLNNARVSLAALAETAGRDIARCPRVQYFTNMPFMAQKPLFKNAKSIIGIHLGGSAFSIGTQKRFGVVSKALPSKLITRLLSDNFNFVLFGSKEEIAAMKFQERENLKFVHDKNITSSLSYVSQCRCLIGSDSAFKTMSAMLKIPTIVWLGDYRDDARDQIFINPYLADGVMSIIRYTNLESEEQFNAALDLTKGMLSKLSPAGPG